MLNDFIATLPIDVIRKVEVEDDKIVIPAKIDSKEFYKKHKEEIDTDIGFSAERAIYIVSVSVPQSRKSISELLIRGR